MVNMFLALGKLKKVISMNNKFDYIFDPDWSEFKLVDIYYDEVDKVRNNPDDLEELRQAFLNASSEHDQRILKRKKEENILILE